MNRIKELDGLRGAALLLVITVHLTNRAVIFTENHFLQSLDNYFIIGWIGLDIFFPLSGFLITSILLQTKTEEHYFKNFYIRRALRVFPLYYLLLITTFFFVPNLEEEFISNLDVAVPVLLLYQQNWALLFPDFHFSSYLGITWSLAVEEQFYLLLPFLVYKFDKARLAKLIIGYILISMSARIFTALFWHNLAEVSNFFFYASFSRFEQIFFGSLLAIYLTYQGSQETIRRFSLPLFIFSAIFLISLILLSWPQAPDPQDTNLPLILGSYTATAMLTIGLIGIFITYPPQNFLRRIFQTRLLVFLGKHSYSIYIYHVTIAVIAFEIFWDNGFRGWQAYFMYLLVTYSLSILVGVLTWHLIEKHLLRLKKYFPYKNPFEL